MELKGFVNLNKPEGMTSNDAVVKLRGILKAASGEKKLKVGHLGTLDPLATGVLPIAVGRATKLFDILLQKSKTYIATFKFGETTDTLDRGGKITLHQEMSIDEAALDAACASFLGEYAQIPPQYSAKSVDGKHAYDLAREGKNVELAPKNVTIYSINRLKLEYLSQNEYGFEIKCSSGTYIRALARDIATKLNTVGYMTSLTRTQSGPFLIENSVSIEAFAAEPAKYLLPLNFALVNLPLLELGEEEARRAENGIPVALEIADGEYRVARLGQLFAIGDVTGGKLRLRIRL